MHLTEQQHNLSYSSRFAWLNILARFDAKNWKKNLTSTVKYFKLATPFIFKSEDSYEKRINEKVWKQPRINWLYFKCGIC